MAKRPLPKFPKYKKEVISGGLILSVMLPCPSLLKGSFLKEPLIVLLPNVFFLAPLPGPAMMTSDLSKMKHPCVAPTSSP